MKKALFISALALCAAAIYGATITSLGTLPDGPGSFTRPNHSQVQTNIATTNTNFANVNTQLGQLLAGDSTALTSAPLPATAGGVAIGSNALPFLSLFIGDAATNNLNLIGTATGARTITFPDASITVSGAVAQSCATTTSCSHTNESTALKVVFGSVALTSGSPSTAAVTGISPAFTSSSTFHCTASDATTIANNVGVLTAGYVSGSAVTFTGPNTVTDSVRYVCVGY